MKKILWLSFFLLPVLLAAPTLAVCEPCVAAREEEIRIRAYDDEVTTSAKTQAEVKEGLTQEAQHRFQEQVQDVIQAQEQLNEEAVKLMEKAQTRSDLMFFLFGPDWGAVKLMKQQLEQNQNQVKNLLELKIQTQNQAEQDMLQQVIQTVEKQNTSLQEAIQSQEGGFSLFGWVFRLFNK
jgi:DNA-binding ferritin-like protein